MRAPQDPEPASLLEEVGMLLEQHRDGALEDAQVARLDQLLADHPEALDYFVDRAWLQADLEFRLGRRPVAPPEVERLRHPRRRAGWKFFLGAAAAAGLLAWILMGLPLRSRRGDPIGLSYEGCAVLTRSLDTIWDGSAPGPALGSVLPKRELKLLSGSIQVEFFSGARVILEGPAEFELASANSGICRYGKLRAFVPPQARGFSVQAAGIELVDRGTEFGLRLVRDGDPEVHVFQGRVEIHAGGAALDLGVGNAVRIGRGGGTEAIASDPEAFLTFSQLNVRTAEEAKGRFARWGTASDRLRQDPRIAVYYSFEDAPSWSRELRCQRTERSPLDGAIIGARWAEGRWQGKTALEFKCPGDRVRFQDAGAYESLTLMTWVRVDGLDRPFSGLMLTDGWTSGSVHWQITDKGLLRLGIHGDHQAFDYDTGVVFGPAQLGRWVHLCTVYDRQAREVRHYVEGRLARRLPLKFDTMLRLGNVELGNWGVPLEGNIYAIRNLNGRMDEFAVFGAALGEAEIRELYQVGAPAP
jgi:hypothetical protein